MMNTKEQVCIEILTPLSLTSKADGEKVLNLWEKFLPDCLPDKFGNYEPIDNFFDLNNREVILDRHWQWPFLAKKKKPKMDASVWMRKGKILQHGAWTLSFRFDEIDITKLSRFLAEAAKELQADFSCITLFTKTEIEFGRLNRTAFNLDKKATKFFFSIYSQDLQKRIPDIYWITVFGPPYVKMFGKDKLLSAPAYKTQLLNEEFVFIQLTKNPEDVRDVPTYFETKKLLKAHLGEDLFFNVEKSTFKHPDFIWK